jgi:hypothetical protein
MACDEGILPRTVRAWESVDTFEHEPLTDATKQIRLFTLHPSSVQDDTLSGTVENFDFEQCPEYLALSYEWGALDTHDITIDRQRLQIRTNLWLFLTYWSRRAIPKQQNPLHTLSMIGTKYWWIDQICINQSSPVERSHQVRLMSAIFPRARCVVAWLGTETEVEAYLDDQTDSESGSSRFRNASYFSRLWVQQELLLAKQVFFAAGDALLPWSNIRKRKSFLTPGYELPAILELLLKTKFEPLRLFKAIEQFSSCYCADPRDKVYGLLGMIGSGPSLEIDYSLQPKQVLHATVDRVLTLERCDYGVKRTLVNLAISMGLEGEVEHVEDLADKRYPFGSTRKTPRDRSGMMTPGDFASLQEGREGLSTEDYAVWKLP